MIAPEDLKKLEELPGIVASGYRRIRLQVLVWQTIACCLAFQAPGTGARVMAFTAGISAIFTIYQLGRD